MALTSLTPLGKSKQNQPHTQMDSIWSNNNNSNIQHNDDNDSWEVRAFEEDTASNLLGCTWPPRSYTCTFCRREFRSAQALGGHMNVHRRDRARQLQPLAAPPPEFSANANAFCLHYRLPNPNSIPFPIPIHFSSPLPNPATAKPSDTTPNSVVSSVCTEPSPSSSNDNHRENAVVEEELDLELRLGRRQSQGTP